MATALADHRRGFARCRTWPATLLACAVLLGAQASEAQSGGPLSNCPPNPGWGEEGEMRFTVQQQPGERAVLLAEGIIDEGLLPRLQAALAGFNGGEVWLRSAGGDARVAQRAGMMIRARNLGTRIPAGWACAGFCNFMFLGGTRRRIDDGGLFIVQMFALDGDTNDLDLVAVTSAMVASEFHDYLIRMGVSRRLLPEVMYRQRARSAPGAPATYHCLTPDEIIQYQVANLPSTQ